MGTDLQRLRDEAERRCHESMANNDSESADAWERIAMRIDETIKLVRGDLIIIEARTGLFGLRKD